MSGGTRPGKSRGSLQGVLLRCRGWESNFGRVLLTKALLVTEKLRDQGEFRAPLRERTLLSRKQEKISPSSISAQVSEHTISLFSTRSKNPFRASENRVTYSAEEFCLQGWPGASRARPHSSSRRTHHQHNKNVLMAQVSFKTIRQQAPWVVVKTTPQRKRAYWTSWGGGSWETEEIKPLPTAKSICRRNSHSHFGLSTLWVDCQ